MHVPLVIFYAGNNIPEKKVADAKADPNIVVSFFQTR